MPGPSLIGALERALARPERFAPHDAPFWDDPHIARGMLAAHLEAETDAASRRRETVLRTVEHLVRSLGLQPGDRLLDLGCGPGLYAAEFAARDLAVHGVDLSPGSIDHARTAARHAGRRIEYRVADYTADPLGGPFDAATLIYLDLGVLPEAPLERLLDGVRAALRPGGAFAFDVHGPARTRVVDGRIEVHRSDGGFWRPGPHLVVETTYRYGRDLDLNQIAIVDDRGGITTYRVWDRAYSVTELRSILGRHGFRIEAVWADLTGSPWHRGAQELAILARRSLRRRAPVRRRRPG